FATIPTVSAQVRAKKLRALAVTSDSRFQFLPEVPAMAELFPGFRAEVWVGMFAPAKVAQAIVSRLNAEAVKAVAAEDVKARFAEIGMTSVGSSPVALDRWLRFEMERWGKVIRDNRITLE
ncbi:MAG: tripartite tricarboxylate transporter substrate binding protein, partial [Burkholderiales bacterium]|nr:tripartite tricarboxylate transporter substrate binding protein [Burkholderiales bacterium]